MKKDSLVRVTETDAFKPVAQTFEKDPLTIAGGAVAGMSLLYVTGLLVK